MPADTDPSCPPAYRVGVRSGHSRTAVRPVGDDRSWVFELGGPEEKAMKNLIVAIFGLAAALAAQPPAEAGVEKIVYDTCGMFGCGIFMANPDGSDTVRVPGGDGGADPRWSPDGSKIAFGEGSISVLSLSDRIGIILFDSPAHDWGPAWSPDGAQIAFGGWRDGQPQLYVVNVDGSSLTRLTFNARFAGGPAWFPDGSRIAFNCQVESGNWDICAINADGTGLVRLTTDPGD